MQAELKRTAAEAGSIVACDNRLLRDVYMMMNPGLRSPRLIQAAWGVLHAAPEAKGLLEKLVPPTLPAAAKAALLSGRLLIIDGRGGEKATLIIVLAVFIALLSLHDPSVKYDLFLGVWCLSPQGLRCLRWSLSCRKPGRRGARNGR